MVSGASSQHGSPLILALSEFAEAEIDEAYRWMQRFGFEVAEKWLASLQSALNREIELHENTEFRRQVLEAPGSGRDLFQIGFHSNRKGSSPWLVTYELIDDDEDGIIDTLRVVRVRHAASQQP